MIKKTEGIVLRSMRFQESSLICNIYTQESGLQSFIVKGYRSSRSRKKHSYFQPLSIIDLVYYYRENRELQHISECQLSALYTELQTDPVKLSLGLTMVEIFRDCVREEEQNLPLYRFLRNNLLALENAQRPLIQLFVYFLTHLSGYLGFFPHDETGEDQRGLRFDLREGTFFPVSNQSDEVAGLLYRFTQTDLEHCREIIFNSEQKRALIKLLFDYYGLHIQGFRYPQTMQVFSEVFS